MQIVSDCAKILQLTLFGKGKFQCIAQRLENPTELLRCFREKIGVLSRCFLPPQFSMMQTQFKHSRQLFCATFFPCDKLEPWMEPHRLRSAAQSSCSERVICKRGPCISKKCSPLIGRSNTKKSSSNCVSRTLSV